MNSREECKRIKHMQFATRVSTLGSRQANETKQKTQNGMIYL